MTDQNKASADEQAPPDFAAFLLATNKGRTHDELSREFAKLISAVQETGKPGVLQLRIDVKPVKGTEGEQVVVTDSVTSKSPKLDRPASMFFVTDGGGLSRNDPRQTSMFEIQENPQR